MRVFFTGASGWIGSAVVPELLDAGHEVVGLARSREAAAALHDKGVEVHRGDLDDLESLRKGADAADGVVHLAFKHDFSDYAGAGRTERSVLETLCETLAGSGRPLLFASGVAGIRPGHVVTENDSHSMRGPDAPRGGGEELAFGYTERGVRPVALRFSNTVHGVGDHGFISTIIDAAQETGVSGYVGDGSNRWPAVHVRDAARMTRLALEKAPPGSVMHAVGEEGIATREIAEVIGHELDIPSRSVDPDEALSHFGWVGSFFALDTPASSSLTQQSLNWTPVEPGLIEDLRAGHYFRR